MAGGVSAIGNLQGKVNSAGALLVALDTVDDLVVTGDLEVDGGFSVGTTPPPTGQASIASSVTSGGAFITVSGTAGFGFGAGAGGVVTQATNKSTTVQLDKATGQITMNNAALNAGVAVSFTLTNSAIGANDFVMINHHSAGTPGAYLLTTTPAAGSAVITVRNITAGNLSEAIVLQYFKVRGAIT